MKKEELTVDKDYLEEKFNHLNTQLDNIKKDMVTQISCYKNHEPIRLYMWIIGFSSSLGSSVLTAVVVWKLKEWLV
jgi:hypothetical protein